VKQRVFIEIAKLCNEELYNIGIISICVVLYYIGSASVGRILKCGRHIFVLGVLQGSSSPLKSLKRQHPLSGWHKNEINTEIGQNRYSKAYKVTCRPFLFVIEIKHPKSWNSWGAKCGVILLIMFFTSIYLIDKVVKWQVL